jgi:hypothetical protein
MLVGTLRRSLGDLESLIDRVQWSEGAQHDLLVRFDVGIFPLPDSPYSRGKCGYKLLQYGATGNPRRRYPGRGEHADAVRARHAGGCRRRVGRRDPRAF